MGNKYKAEKNGDKFFFVDSKGEKLKTPNGIEVYVNNEEIIDAVISDLSDKSSKLGSSRSLKTFLFTYCDRIAIDPECKNLRKIFNSSIDYDMLLSDQFLMFKQPSPIRQAYAGFFEEQLPKAFDDMCVGELIAYQCVMVSYESFMLPYYISYDVLHNLNESGDNKEELIDCFVNEMRDFLLDPDDYEEKPDEAYVDQYVEKMKKVIELYILVSSFDRRK